MTGITIRAAADRVTLQLFGDVGWDITVAGVAKALKDAGDKPITVCLNSYGGDALAGIAIHNMIARHPAPKTVIVEGVAASSASLIAMAGDRIVMPENAFLMIHETWGFAGGDAETMRQQAEVLDQVSGAYRRTYAARTGKDENEITEMMRAETWFSAAAAVEHGFATEAAPPAEVKAFAAVPQGRFCKVPESLASIAQPPAVPAPTEEATMAEPNTPAAAEPAAPVMADAGFVLDIAERNNLPVTWANAQIRAAGTREAVLTAALDAVVAAGAKPLATEAPKVVADEKPVLLARLSGAMHATFTGRAPKDDEREFAGLGFHALGRELLIRAGERNVHRLGPDALVERILANTHSASDFSAVLANSTNKTLRDLYGALPNNWAAWADETEVDDFKTITAGNIGQFPEPVEIAEGGPVTYGTIGEEAETYAVKERGRLLGLTRVALVNDDLRAFQRLTQAAALAGYTALRRTVFGVLTANAAMADGTALFASGHFNLGTAGNLSATTLKELRALLAKMTGPSRTGQSPAAAPLPPPQGMVLIVGPDEEDIAMELLGNRIVPTATGAVLPDGFRSNLSMVSDAFLDTGNDPYYLARTDFKAVEIAYLRGRRVPTVTSAETIDRTGMTFRVMFDFGAKAVTWRTIAGNLGG